MVQNDATTTEIEPTSKQAEYASQIGTIVVDPDEVIKHLEKNQKLPATYTPRKFKVEGVRSGGRCRASPKVDPRDEGAYYDSKPHPVWIPAGLFVRGWSRDEEGDRPRWPSRHTTKSVLRDEHPDLDEDSEEFRQLLDEWHDEALDVWRDQIRHRLKDEITLTYRASEWVDGEMHERSIDVTIPVEYETRED